MTATTDYTHIRIEVMRAAVEVTKFCTPASTQYELGGDIAETFKSACRLLKQEFDLQYLLPPPEEHVDIVHTHAPENRDCRLTYCYSDYPPPGEHWSYGRDDEGKGCWVKRG
jgi:hypothetical protein